MSQSHTQPVLGDGENRDRKIRKQLFQISVDILNYRLHRFTDFKYFKLSIIIAKIWNKIIVSRYIYIIYCVIKSEI